MTIINATSLTKIYGQNPNIVKALDGVDLSISQSEFLAIVGASGSGKSTLLHMLGGLDKPTKGAININGMDLSSLNDEELTVYRRKNIGFIFQNYNLVPTLNVYENITLPIELDGSSVDEEYLEKVLSTLGLKNKKFSMPNMLSGGQQQRVAIARALATKPSLILADEPTGNLDTVTSNEVLKALKDSAKKFNQTVVMITHNDAIAKLANRTIRIQDGKIIDEVIN